MRNIEQINAELFMQVEEQIHADISRILFCIYNNYPIDEYFKQLMRI